MSKLPSLPVSQVSGNTLCDQPPEDADPREIPAEHLPALFRLFDVCRQVVAEQRAAALAAQEEAA